MNMSVENYIDRLISRADNLPYADYCRLACVQVSEKVVSSPCNNGGYRLRTNKCIPGCLMVVGDFILISVYFTLKHTGISRHLPLKV